MSSIFAYEGNTNTGYQKSINEDDIGGRGVERRKHYS